MERLYRVVAPWFVVGFVCRGGIVTEATGVVKYLRGWGEERALSYLLERGFEVNQVA